MNDPFSKFVAELTPYSWTITEGHPNQWLNGNHSLCVNFVRFNRILNNLQLVYEKGSRILDVGVFPGLMPQLFYHFYPRDYSVEYFGLGLGFTHEFQEEMGKLGVKLLAADLDPRIKNIENSLPSKIPLEDESVDLVFLTDVIEHFFDPFYPLTEINRVLKEGGILLLTTDNIARYESLNLMIRGQTPGVPLIESNLFYNGPWRPHFREYSKMELFQLLEWAGFNIVHHEFYEAEFGFYRATNGNLTKKKHLGIKSFIRNNLKTIFPHLKDNHLIVARKLRPYSQLNKSAPQLTDNFDLWMQQRIRFSL